MAEGPSSGPSVCSKYLSSQPLATSSSFPSSSSAPPSPAPSPRQSSFPLLQSKTPPDELLAVLRTLNPSMLAGSGAGLVSSVVTCPLDVIKTRLQAQAVSRSHTDYQGVLATSKTILSQSGIRGFYRGLGPTVLGYIPTWAIYFTVYDAVKLRLGNGGDPSLAASPKSDHSISVHIVAAMTAGATGTVVTNPLWVIKTRFMAQSVKDPTQKRYSHTLDAIRTIYRQEGLRAFYKGLTPSLFGISHVAVQFPLYEQLKFVSLPDDGTALPPHTILLCSATSKMVASLITYPHEVVRTRLQIQRSPSAQPPAPSSSSSSSPSRLTSRPSLPSSSPSPSHPSTPGLSSSAAASDRPHVRLGGALGVRQGSASYKGLWRTLRQILASEGWTGFYRGLSINLVRTVPNSAVTMLTYEILMRQLHEWRDAGSDST